MDKKIKGRRTQSLYNIIKNGSKALSTERNTSMPIHKPEQNELPLPGVIFKEGYLFKRARTSGINWKRRFFKLEDTELTYAPVFGAPEKASFEIVEGTTVTPVTEFPNHPYCLEIKPPAGSEDHENPLYVAADSKECIAEWERTFSLCLNKIAGLTVNIKPVTARFYEGTLFKTPKVPNKWEAKHFELENGVMYYFDPKAGQRNLTFKAEKKQIRLHGAQVFLNKTDAKGVPFQGKPFQIKEAGSLRLFNLAAPNDEEYLRWLKAIRAWMSMLSDTDEETQV